MRLLLFSDLHLETRFAWAPPAVAGARRDALRACLRRIGELATTIAVDALCCGGDLFEQERHRPDTAAFLRETFAALDPLPVYLAPGNHDWLAPQSLYARTEWSPNVHVFLQDRLTPATLDDGLTLWGAGHHSPTNTRGFLDDFRVDRGGVHLGLFHGSAQGVAIEDPSTVRHAPFRADQIGASGLHHALLGHYHTPRHAPDHTYPGNPEPLTFGEQGERGPVLVEVTGSGEVRRTVHPVAATTLADITVDLTGVRHGAQVQDRVDAALDRAGGAVRLTLHGEIDPDVAMDSGRLRRRPGIDAWVVRSERVSYGYDLAALASEQTVRGQFVRDVQADPSLSESLRRRVLLTGLRALDGRDDLVPAADVATSPDDRIEAG
jgi:DNA repair exonuclease SbcCD nuclease subunit